MNKKISISDVDTLSVVKLGHPALRQKSARVRLAEIESSDFQTFIDVLIRTMRVYQGVGIAAPQVGVPKQIFCVECKVNKRYSNAPNIPVYVVINPKLTILNQKKVGLYEGCLSIPDLRAPVYRASKVRIEGWDRYGKPLKKTVSGFHARILQHEYDHIQGKVFLDRIASKDKKHMCYVEYL